MWGWPRGAKIGPWQNASGGRDRAGSTGGADDARGGRGAVAARKKGRVMNRPCRRNCNGETALQVVLVFLFVALTLLTWSSLASALVSGT